MRGRGVYGRLEDFCVGRTGATCNDQRERMPWREFRVGGMGVCLAYASAYRKQGHGYMLRLAHAVLNIDYRTPYMLSISRGVIAYSPRCASRRPPREPGSTGRGRHRASLFGSRDCTDPTPRSLATCHRPPLAPRARTIDPMPLALVFDQDGVDRRHRRA